MNFLLPQVTCRVWGRLAKRSGLWTGYCRIIEPLCDAPRRLLMSADKGKRKCMGLNSGGGGLEKGTQSKKVQTFDFKAGAGAEKSPK